MEPMTQQTKSDRTRQRILDAAAVCFSESGYSGVTLRDIADRANMKAGSLYYHFHSKENLVEEVLCVGVFNAFESTRRAVEALGHKNNRESQRQKRQSGEVSQSEVARKEIAHVGAEDTCKAERRPVSRAKHGQVNSLHRSVRFLMA